MVTYKVTQWWYCVVFEVFCDLNYDISPVVKDCYVSIMLFLIGWCLWFVLNLKFKRVLIHGHGSSANHLNLYKKKRFWIYIRTVWKKLQFCWDILITLSTYKPVRVSFVAWCVWSLSVVHSIIYLTFVEQGKYFPSLVSIFIY